MKILSPNPWGPEVERILQDPNLEPLCHRCFTPHSHQARFCPVCDASVGEYNNYMPYVNIFPQAEVLRSGVHDHVRPSFLIIAGYLLLSVTCYIIFAPIYWFFLFRNLKRQARIFEQDASGSSLSP